MTNFCTNRIDRVSTIVETVYCWIFAEIISAKIQRFSRYGETMYYSWLVRGTGSRNCQIWTNSGLRSDLSGLIGPEIAKFCPEGRLTWPLVTKDQNCRLWRHNPAVEPELADFQDKVLNYRPPRRPKVTNFCPMGRLTWLWSRNDQNCRLWRHNPAQEPELDDFPTYSWLSCPIGQEITTFGSHGSRFSSSKSSSLAKSRSRPRKSSWNQLEIDDLGWRTSRFSSSKSSSLAKSRSRPRKSSIRWKSTRSRSRDLENPARTSWLIGKIQLEELVNSPLWGENWIPVGAPRS